jgi:hypothetical protein
LSEPPAGRRESAPPDDPDWIDDLARIVYELDLTIRSEDRHARVGLLIKAVARHFRDMGDPEPRWLTLAREQHEAGAFKEG